MDTYPPISRYIDEVNAMAMKRFIDITDFSREELRETLNKISYIRDNRSVYSKELSGKTIITAFYEDDPMMEISFNVSAARMGGTVVPYRGIKGMPLREEAKMLSANGDAIVIRHPLRGAARAMSLYSSIPVINAGDGGRAYPVRTLTDIATVWQYKHHVSNMKIGFLGDFSDNAFVKGLLQCLNLYKGNEFYFISVNGKQLNPDYVALMDKREKPFVVVNDLFDVLPQLDVLYVTKVTEDNFNGEVEYETKKSNFILDERMLLVAKPDLVILHPMPRGEEISPEVDDDDRAIYFNSINIFNDVCVAAYTKTISNKSTRNVEPDFEEDTHDEICGKANCITSQEAYLPSLFYEKTDGRMICKYCGQELIKEDE